MGETGFGTTPVFVTLLPWGCRGAGDISSSCLVLFPLQKTWGAQPLPSPAVPAFAHFGCQQWIPWAPSSGAELLLEWVALHRLEPRLWRGQGEFNFSPCLNQV